MSDPYAWLDNQGGTVQKVQDPYAWLDEKKSELKPKTKAFNIDFNAPEKEVRNRIAMLPKSQREAARKQWADAYVAREREENKGSWSQYANDVVRNLARGTPIGSWLDEANAQTAALFGGNYDEAIAYQRAQDRAVDAESTKLAELPVIGDVTVGGAQKLAGGLMSVPVTAPLNVVRSGSAMLPRIANAVSTGLGYGALYGAGLGEGGADRLKQGVIGGGAGAVLGGVSVPAGNAIAHLIPSGARRSQALQAYHPSAVKKVARGFGDDFDVTSRVHPPAAQYAAKASDLGNKGMLADMGPNMQAQLGAVGNMPGRGKQIVHRALGERAAGSQQRINKATDKALGPARNLVEVEKSIGEAANKAANPLYDQFRKTSIEITPKLASILKRADAAGALDGAAKRMQIEGIDPSKISNNGQLLDLIKRSIDGAAGKAKKAGDYDLYRVYTGLARDLRSEVDTLLSPKDPSQSIWAQARKASGEGMQFKEGLEQGQKAFARNLSPDQMRADMTGMSPPQLAAYREGARGQIRQQMGNASTQFGENASAKGRALLGSGNAREKLRMLAPGRDGSKLVRRLDAEADFARTNQSVLQNSQTANRQAAQREFPGQVDGNYIANEIGKKTGGGVMMEAAYRTLNKALAGALDERRLAIARDAADMLVAQGAARDDIAAALLKQAAAKGISAQRRQALQSFAKFLAEGSRQQLISSPME